MGTPTSRQFTNSRVALSTLVASAIAAFTLTPGAANAAENGFGFYLLGSKEAVAGIIPPPGLYFQNDIYYFSGSASPGKDIPLDGRLTAGLKAKNWVDAPTLLWSTPVQILGGNLALSATVPIGGPRIGVAATLTGPGGGTIATNLHDSIFTVGDPLLGASIAWHAGDFHWNVGVLVNTPIGDYRNGALANLAFDHWGEDFNAAFTWLNPRTGLEISSAIGITVNQLHSATQYKTGNEFHYEGAVIQHFPNGFAVGLIGYYYNQISGDSGAGAVLGPFEGRVSALGGYAGYTFKVEERPITASIKVLREFDAQNRLSDGVAAYFTIAMPISTMPAPSAPPKALR